MKKRFSLFNDADNEPISIGLARLVKFLQPHILFFQINSQKNMRYQRKRDLEVFSEYYRYDHIVFEAHQPNWKNKILFIQNKNSNCTKIKEIDRLFVEETEDNYLLDKYTDVEYLVKTSNNIRNFSLISLPENLFFQIQPYELEPDNELYKIIQYYE